MLPLVTIWWLAFFSAVGLCLGSFLNVVIYRLPMGLALSQPRWSFCPSCHNRIAWYHNLPVISYLRLGGRCYNCWKPISPLYPLVELMTAMVVIGLLDAFFIEQARGGLHHVFDLSCRLSEDWPIFSAHVILMTSLFAMSAIDLQFYWVDIRFTHFAAFCGVILHTLWTPSHNREWLRPLDGTALTCIAALVGFTVVWLFLSHEHKDEQGEDDTESLQSPDSVEVPADARDDAARRVRPIKSVALPLAVFLFVWTVVAISALESGWSIPYVVRASIPLVFFFFVILRAAAYARESDTQIAEAIEFEAPGVRSRTLVELAVLSPSIIFGAITLWLILHNESVDRALVGAIHWAPFDTAWQPVWGFGTAVSGYVIAAGIGWSIRIVANLAFGKEAFATGDIHMMAAAGAVAGWQIVLLGFMITCMLALFGWVVLLPVKKTHVIPLGPWLTMGFLVATLFYKELVATSVVKRFIVVADLLFFNNSHLLPFE